MGKRVPNLSAAQRVDNQSVLRGIENCKDGKEFWTGFNCFPCSNCSLGQYHLSECKTAPLVNSASGQDTQCGECEMPSNARAVTIGSSASSCVWLCNESFKEDPFNSTCQKCPNCLPGFLNACGYGKKTYIIPNNPISNDGATCYLECEARDFYFAGIWGINPPECACVSKPPNKSDDHETGCQKLSQKAEWETCPLGAQPIASFSTWPDVLLLEAKENRVSLTCSMSCQKDASCDCFSSHSVDSKGTILGPACFHSSHPCQVVSGTELPQPSFGSGMVVHTKVATACLACPKGIALDKDRNCVCGTGKFLNFVTPKCKSPVDGLLEIQHRSLAPPESSSGHVKQQCAADALSRSAPIFCVNESSSQCLLYHPHPNVKEEVCAPNHPGLDCFMVELFCEQCSMPVSLSATNNDVTCTDSVCSNLDFDNGWEWNATKLALTSDACPAKCLDGYWLATCSRETNTVFRYPLIMSTTKVVTTYTCFDSRIQSMYFSTFGVGVMCAGGLSIFFIWQKACFHTNPFLCSCGVGFAIYCKKHSEASSAEDILDCLECTIHHHSNVMCGATDYVSRTRLYVLLLLILNVVSITLFFMNIFFNDIFMGNCKYFSTGHHDLIGSDFDSFGAWMGILFSFVPLFVVNIVCCCDFFSGSGDLSSWKPRFWLRGLRCCTCSKLYNAPCQLCSFRRKYEQLEVSTKHVRMSNNQKLLSNICGFRRQYEQFDLSTNLGYVHMSHNQKLVLNILAKPKFCKYPNDSNLFFLRGKLESWQPTHENYANMTVLQGRSSEVEVDQNDQTIQSRCTPGNGEMYTFKSRHMCLIGSKAYCEFEILTMPTPLGPHLNTGDFGNLESSLSFGIMLDDNIVVAPDITMGLMQGDIMGLACYIDDNLLLTVWVSLNGTTTISKSEQLKTEKEMQRFSPSPDDQLWLTASNGLHAAVNMVGISCKIRYNFGKTFFVHLPPDIDFQSFVDFEAPLEERVVGLRHVLVGDTLPQGLSLDMVTGEISGAFERDEDVGKHDIRIQVIDQWGRFQPGQVWLHLYAVEIQPSTLVYPKEFDMHVGFPVGTITPEFTDGYPKPYFLVVASGDGLPDGLRLDDETGYISGSPNNSGVFSVEIEAKNDMGSCKCNIKIFVFVPVNSGPHLKDYHFVKLLAKGAQGAVWLARPKDKTAYKDTLVAIKVQNNLSGTTHFREVENLTAISLKRHPNLVRILDVVDTVDCLGLIMEYVDGTSLKAYLGIQRQNKMDWEQSSIIMCGILSGLECLHTLEHAPMIHRDLKPENVMLATKEGPVNLSTRVVLVDFGLAKRNNVGQTMTQAGSFIGTPAYFSPEHCSGKKLDLRTDIWAAGIVLYEMLSGKHPFLSSKEESDDGTRMLELFEAIRSLKICERRLPFGLGVNSFIMRALEQERSKRFEDAQNMFAVFQEVCKNPAIIPEQLTKPQRPSVLDRPEKPGIVGFFAKKISDTAEIKKSVQALKIDFTDTEQMAVGFEKLLNEKIENLDIHKEAEQLMLGFTHPRSAFTVDIYSQPTIKDFADVMASVAHKNVRIVHFSGHGETDVGFFWLNTKSNEYEQTSLDFFAGLFKTESAGSRDRGTVDCVVLNACNTEMLGQRIRLAGVPHVVCWRTEVQNATAITFAKEFYKSLDEQDLQQGMDYPKAFRQAAARMLMWGAASSDTRKKAPKFMASHAQDFIYLLSTQGDHAPEKVYFDKTDSTSRKPLDASTGVVFSAESVNHSAALGNVTLEMYNESVRNSSETGDDVTSTLPLPSPSSEPSHLFPGTSFLPSLSGAQLEADSDDRETNGEKFFFFNESSCNCVFDIY